MEKDKRYVVPTSTFRTFLKLVEEKERLEAQISTLFNTYREFLNVPENYLLNQEGEFVPQQNIQEIEGAAWKATQENQSES